MDVVFVGAIENITTDDSPNVSRALLNIAFIVIIDLVVIRVQS